MIKSMHCHKVHFHISAYQLSYPFLREMLLHDCNAIHYPLSGLT